MRILVTNDDGINAPGLRVLEDIAHDIAGQTGEVWVVAPAFEQSGVAHCINYTQPTQIAELAPRRFAVEGSPADCVLAGVHHVLKDNPPDLVLSGVNRGNNAAENVVYSGTLGAALEGAMQGVTSIAMSQFFGPAILDLENPFEAAAKHGSDVVRKILDAAPVNDDPYELFYNVNFPPVPAEDVKGIRVAPQGRRENVRFSVDMQRSPTGRSFLWAKGGDQRAPTLQGGTDTDYNLQNYISVTPLRADMTAKDALMALKGIE